MNALHSDETKNKLNELYRYICAQSIAQKIVGEHLSKRERQSLTKENGAVMPEFVARIAERRGLSTERVVIDLALEHSVVDAGEYKKLRRRIGEPVEGDVFSDGESQRNKTTAKPRWDAATGKLFLGDELIGKFRVRPTHSKPQVILHAFQEADWANCIPEPFQGELDQSRLHLAVNYLNGRVKHIRFHAQAGATELTWDTK